MNKNKFWQILSLSEMTKTQWESLCDSCGRCCLHKIEDEETNEIYFTNVACHYLDEETCQCAHYDTRQSKVPDCLTIYPNWGKKFNWLPITCAYRLISKGRPLFDWHHLISGDVNSVHLAGISVRGRTLRDDRMGQEEVCKHVISWIE